MWKNRVKSEKGITMMSLVVYMVIFTMIIGALTTISTFFYTNIGEVVDAPQYVYEFNKFVMFFGLDIKNYNNAVVTENSIQFEDGPTYIYQNNAIYRDDVLIAKNIIACNFELTQYPVNTINKNIINVDIQIGKSQADCMTKSVDFTLKYW